MLCSLKWKKKGGGETFFLNRISPQKNKKKYIYIFKIRLKLHTVIADKQAIGQIPTSSVNFQLNIINKERTEKYALYMIDMQQNNNF